MVDATTVASLDIWLVLVLAQQAQVLSQVLVADLVLLVEDSTEVLPPEAHLPVDPVPLLATSVEGQTTLLEIAKRKL